jgi:pyruvate,water dikinase
MKNDRSERLILWFDEIDKKDVPLVGGKNASLGEMIRHLDRKGISVPKGFAVTSYAYRMLIRAAGIEDKIIGILSDLDKSDVKKLSEKGKEIRGLITHAPLPPELEEEIRQAYRKMEEMYGKGVDVAARSSATAEDLPTASFAGQQETYLNIRGEDALLQAVRKCFASLFTNRAISYREDKGFDHSKVYLSVGVQKMVRSDISCSGVAFSIDTETGFKDALFMNASWGLGEAIVGGKVNPDQYYVFKPTLKKGFRPIVEKRLGNKRQKFVYGEEGTKFVDTTEKERGTFVLTEDEIIKLSKWICIIEDHYRTPMDIEWAKDGPTGDLFIVQARPETVHSQSDATSIETYVLEGEGKVLVEGEAVGSKIASGKVNVIEDASRIHEFNKGEILVTNMTDPDWEPIMKISAGIITNRGGRTCHAAIISRELGIPCVIGSNNATELLKDGDEVTIDCSEGRGLIYGGMLKFRVDRIELDKIPKTRTKIMMNVGVPEKAFIQGQIPNEGVGLAREEFIISSHIGIHPTALIEYSQLKERAKSDKKLAKAIEEIDRRSVAYSDKVEFFVDSLAQGIGKIAAGFYPNDVIVRLSDFKTNEYASLVCGYLYEPEESNPMIGWRGASRYYDKNFKESFGLECKAIKKVREEMGLTNLKVMVPFCRTPAEGREVIKTMKDFGLKQGEKGLEVYVMCEIPSNVILADEFADIFDGFSIGSNDLTQLTLGLDRDSDLVAFLFDERNEAVKRMISSVISTAKKRKCKTGICGQAPSDFPEFAEFLVECGIDSMSLNPDTAVKTRLLVAEKERKMARRSSKAKKGKAGSAKRKKPKRSSPKKRKKTKRSRR